MLTPRVVSLVPSATETLVAWGIVPVACTRFCEQPDLRRVGGTKDPDVEAVVALAPDVVIVDTEENRREDCDALTDAGVVVHVLSIRSVEDMNEQLAVLAARLDARWHPVEIPREPNDLTAFVPVWRRPWIALGAPTYGSSLLGCLGVTNVFADAGPYPRVLPDDVVRRRPDLVVAPSEPYPFGDRHRGDLAPFGRPCFVDGRDLLWWGARAAGAIDRLRAALARARPRR